MSELITERWVLTAEFDSVAETIRAGVYEGGPGEAAEFCAYCRQQAEFAWGFLEEETGEAGQLDGETVTVSLSIIDPFQDLFQWLLDRTSPK
jgi:hypothetical protein